jgi:hypothetical protein
VFIDIITAKTVRPPSHGFFAPAYPADSPARFKLFGVIHGHFGDDLESDAIVTDGKQKIGVNFGIAMVIPAEKINEVLKQFTETERLETEDARRRCIADNFNTPNVTVQIYSSTTSKTPKNSN